jgi:molybdopterin-guanine dinucleotide biosynthesis protein A
VTGLILAGGRSRRFGSDKALAERDGVPLVVGVHAALAPHTAEVLIATGPAPRRYPVPARVVAGLAAGLEAARTPWVLAAACDLAGLTADALRPLLAAADDGAPDAVVALDGEGRRQPVCTLYRRAPVLPLTTAHLAARRLALHALLDRLAVQEVPLDPAALRNVNAPGDL